MDERTDLQFMKEADTWPLWPFLPVKNRKGDYKQAGGWPTLGTLMNDSPFKKQTEPINYKESIDEIIQNFQKDIDFKPTVLKKYSSLEELTADGWIVD